jgi:hypothetical protein
MRLGSVGRVEERNSSDLDSHADCCICGIEVHVFNNFDREVTVTSWDPEGATKSLWILAAALGYTIMETGKMVILIVHQSIFSPSLSHNLLSAMQMRSHDVVVNETPTCQVLEPTEHSHTISVRCDDMEEVLVIPLELNGVVSCFPTSKPSQEKFYICDRYELTFESTEYDPSVKTLCDQEAGMMYSWGRLKVSGYLHPKRPSVHSPPEGDGNQEADCEIQ